VPRAGRELVGRDAAAEKADDSGRQDDQRERQLEREDGDERSDSDAP
jgi:hypothetical protein